MLQDDAMIVRLSISQWSARKYDTSVSVETAMRYDADPDSGRWNKLLIAREAIQAITQVVNAARSFHYENTLPWDDGGGRILPSKNFLPYSRKMREFKRLFQTAVNDFISNYETYRKKAKQRLNGMFNQTDYPLKAEIAEKFQFQTEIEPIPKSGDFRVRIQTREAERIKKQIEDRLQKRTEEATKDLFLRLSTVVGRFADKMSTKDAIFRDSLVENVAELINLLPKLNVADDPELEKIRAETKKKLCAFEPETLRKSKEVRSKAAEDANAILNKMSAYIGK